MYSISYWVVIMIIKKNINCLNYRLFPMRYIVSLNKINKIIQILN